MTTGRFDVVVAGGGPAGFATALALANQGFSAAVVEGTESTERRMGESLPGVARFALHDLGLWQSFGPELCRPSQRVRSSWGGRLEVRNNSEGIDGPDYHLDRARFDAWLGDRAAKLGVYRIPNTRVTSARFDDAERAWHVDLSAGPEPPLSARFVVDAGGRSATLSRRLGAVRRYADRLVGVARWFRVTACEPSVVIEATAHGWYYSAPAPDDELVTLFVTNAQNARARVQAAAKVEAFADDAPLTRERLRAAVACSYTRGYDASPSITQFDTGAPWLAVGDAALAFDPLSADGLCFALRSGLEAAPAIAAALAGDAAMLVRYRAGARAVFDLHLANRALHYRNERRWPSSEFWSARHAQEPLHGRDRSPLSQ
jgi:flavin-dependent dehydrogenase